MSTTRIKDGAIQLTDDPEGGTALLTVRGKDQDLTVSELLALAKACNVAARAIVRRAKR